MGIGPLLLRVLWSFKVLQGLYKVSLGGLEGLGLHPRAWFSFLREFRVSVLAVSSGLERFSLQIYRIWNFARFGIPGALDPKRQQERESTGP